MKRSQIKELMCNLSIKNIRSCPDNHAFDFKEQFEFKISNKEETFYTINLFDKRDMSENPYKQQYYVFINKLIFIPSIMCEESILRFLEDPENKQLKNEMLDKLMGEFNAIELLKIKHDNGQLNIKFGDDLIIDELYDGGFNITIKDSSYVLSKNKVEASVGEYTENLNISGYSILESLLITFDDALFDDTTRAFEFIDTPYYFWPESDEPSLWCAISKEEHQEYENKTQFFIMPNKKHRMTLLGINDKTIVIPDIVFLIILRYMFNTETYDTVEDSWSWRGW